MFSIVLISFSTFDDNNKTRKVTLRKNDVGAGLKAFSRLALYDNIPPVTFGASQGRVCSRAKRVPLAHSALQREALRTIYSATISLRAAPPFEGR